MKRNFVAGASALAIVAGLGLAAPAAFAADIPQAAPAPAPEAEYIAPAPANWAGFYFMREDQLVLGPFQGFPACVRIQLGQGVCGTAARTGQIQRVDDVHEFPGHIACDAASRSEIVIPLFRDGKVMGVLDIDSPEPGRFSVKDQAGLEVLARLFESSLSSAS